MLRQALVDVPHARVVGEATTIGGAAAAIPRLKPDLVLAAAILGGACVASLLRTLQVEGTFLGRVAFIADRFSHECRDALSGLDPDALLLWGDLTMATLVPCLLVLVAGTLRLRSPRLASAVAAPSADRIMLSARERAVLEGMAAGLTQEQIAASACLSDRSVRRVVTDLQARLDVATPFMLGARAALLGLVDVRIRTAPWPEVDTNLSDSALVYPRSRPHTGDRFSA
jgi:DNA-binding NarL/FixJ family response regulator